MWSYIWLLFGSSLLFLLWAALCSLEKRRQERLVLSRFRNWLDSSWLRLVLNSRQCGRYVVRYLFTLHWYYGLHTLLKTGLRFIANVYFVLEKMFEKNRARTKQLRREQREQNYFFSHLSQHKSAVTLSERKQADIKKRALEGK